jgi:hypothetical protein
LLAGTLAGALVPWGGDAAAQVAATLDDYFMGGTQPEPDPGTFDPILSVDQCGFCHSSYDPVVEPFTPWAASMMGQSARDPMFHACLAVANQDAADAGIFCLRCHVPNAFLAGHAVPTDGSALTLLDLQGINCNFCHRLVDAQFPVPGDGPPPDHQILKALDAEGLVPAQGTNARYVVDPVDSRRGPFDDVPQNVHFNAELYYSPFHQKAEFCWECHDVSNPLLERQTDGTYQLGVLGLAHATGEQTDMFPLHRTYSEWKNSYYFTLGGIQHNGRFGGNHINNPEFIAQGTAGIMHTCQDCHMPDQFGQGCSFGTPFFPRQDAPQHSFIGSNTWGLQSVRTVDADGDTMPDYPDSQTGLSDDSVAAAVARNVQMLENASDLQLLQLSGGLRVRLINFTGHKLPTGFPDGRRMWINVRFLDGEGGLLREHGAYDFDTAVLSTDDTKVYEILLGIDAAQAKATGLPEGPTFHFVLASTIAKDNRIPPTGFSNSVAAANGSAPVGATYVDGQNWDDTLYAVPPCAEQAVVTVYYQLVSRDYIEFLRDTNVTDNRGQVAYDQWVSLGMSQPVVMDMAVLAVNSGVTPDLDGSGTVGIGDLLMLLSTWGPCPVEGPCPADLDCDGAVVIGDLLDLLAAWRGG